MKTALFAYQLSNMSHKILLNLMADYLSLKILSLMKRGAVGESISSSLQTKTVKLYK
jgi:hypothetical protein